MSRSCAIAKCNRTSRGLCDCCQQKLCLQHLNEHNTSLISQLNPLTDEINGLADRLRSINIQQIVCDARQKLEQWCVDCHQIIDRFFKQKCQELDQLIDEKVKKQDKEISQLRSKLIQLVDQQETTRQDIGSLQSVICSLKSQMHKIENTYVQINTQPLLIDERTIVIEEKNEHVVDLSTLSQPFQTLKRSSDSYTSVTYNERHLLFHQKPNLCLIDREMNIVKKILYSNVKICKMCWSSTLNQFVVLTKNEVFIFDEESGLLNIAPITMHKTWFSCACSDTLLFLLTDKSVSSIMQFGSLPIIEFIKEWKSPHICAREEIISDIACQNETLALVIENSFDSIRMELRSVATLHIVWSLQLPIIPNGRLPFRCCPFTGGEWMVADRMNNRLLQITKDGKLNTTLEYPTVPVHATLFGSDILVISGKDGINFHKL